MGLPSCPLSKYLDVADKLFEHFQDAVSCNDESRLDESYVLGLRFAGLVVTTLPQHPEWKMMKRGDESSSNDNNTAQRTKLLTSRVKDVLYMMDVLKDRMDADEVTKIGLQTIAKEEEEIRRKKEEKATEEKRIQRVNEQHAKEQLQRATLDAERAQFNAQLRSQWKKEVKNNFWGLRLRSPVYRAAAGNAAN